MHEPRNHAPQKTLVFFYSYNYFWNNTKTFYFRSFATFVSRNHDGASQHVLGTKPTADEDFVLLVTSFSIIVPGKFSANGIFFSLDGNSLLPRGRKNECQD